MAMMFKSESIDEGVDKQIRSHFVIKGRNPTRLPQQQTEDSRKTVAGEIKSKLMPKRWWTRLNRRGPQSQEKEGSPDS